MKVSKKQQKQKSYPKNQPISTIKNKLKQKNRKNYCYKRYKSQNKNLKRHKIYKSKIRLISQKLLKIIPVKIKDSRLSLSHRLKLKLRQQKIKQHWFLTMTTSKSLENLPQTMVLIPMRLHNSTASSTKTSSYNSSPTNSRLPSKSKG